MKIQHSDSCFSHVRCDLIQGHCQPHSHCPQCVRQDKNIQKPISFGSELPTLLPRVGQLRSLQWSVQRVFFQPFPPPHPPPLPLTPLPPARFPASAPRVLNTRLPRFRTRRAATRTTSRTPAPGPARRRAPPRPHSRPCCRRRLAGRQVGRSRWWCVRSCPT